MTTTHAIQPGTIVRARIGLHEHEETVTVLFLRDFPGSRTWTARGTSPRYIGETEDGQRCMFPPENVVHVVSTLADRGIGPIDVHALRPGGLFAVSPMGPFRTVTAVGRLASGAVMIFHEEPGMPPGSTDRFTLWTSGLPAYGRADSSGWAK